MANPMLAPNYPTYQPPGQALGVLNQLQGLRQQQQAIYAHGMANQLTAGKIAYDRILAANINPDGSINQAGVMEALHNDPSAGLYAQQGYLAGQTRQQQAAATTTAGAQSQIALMDALKAHQQRVSGDLQALGPTPSYAQVSRVGRQLIKDGVITPQQYADYLKTANITPNTPPEELGAKIQALRQQTYDAHEAMLANYGAPTSYGAGSNIITANVSPTRGVTPTGSIRMGVSPNVLLQPTEVTDTNPESPTYGQKKMVALGAVEGPMGGTVPQANFTPAPGFGGSTPAQIERMEDTQRQLTALPGGNALVSPQGLPRAPEAPTNALTRSPRGLPQGNALTGQPLPVRNDNMAPIIKEANAMIAQGIPPAQVDAWIRAQGSGSQSPSQHQVPGVPTALAPWQAAAQSSYAAAGADMRNRWIAEASEAPQVQGTLSQIAAEVKAAKPGPMNEQMTRLGGMLQEFGIGHGGSATATQIWKKGVAQLLTQVAGAAGVRSDMSLATAIEGMPHPTTTPEAALAAQAAISGMQMYRVKRAEAYQSAVAQNPNLTPQDFALQWAEKIPNASVYSFNALPVDIRKRWIHSMSKTDLAAFVKSLQNAGITPDLPPSTPKK